MTPQEQITKDIGRKCADDVNAAIRRNQMLVGSRQDSLIIAMYAAATSVGAVTGTFSAMTGGPALPDAEAIDDVWLNLLRPMVLGQLSSEARA